MDARWDHLKIIAVCASLEDSENLNCSPDRLTAGNKKTLHFGRKNDILTFAVCAMKAGSCAILRREPCQVRKEAAVSVRRMCCGAARPERTRFSFF